MQITVKFNQATLTLTKDQLIAMIINSNNNLINSFEWLSIMQELNGAIDGWFKYAIGQSNMDSLNYSYFVNVCLDLGVTFTKIDNYVIVRLSNNINIKVE